MTSDTDLAGNARIANDRVDIGCYEYDGGLTPVSSYTVTLDANGGSCQRLSMEVDSGATYGYLPAATREGYSFLGWYTSAHGGTRVYESDKVYGRVTLYAQWEAITYTLWFDANGGDCAVYSRDLLYGASYGELPTASRTGYTFLGWYTAASGGSQVTASTVATENITLYAHWEESRASIPEWACGTFSGIVQNWCEACGCDPDEDDCGPWDLNMNVRIGADGSVEGSVRDVSTPAGSQFDWGEFRNGRIVSSTAERVVLSVDLVWHEKDGTSLLTGSLTIYPSGILEYYDGDESNYPEQCPISGTVRKVSADVLVTFNANGGSCSTSSRMVAYGTSLGSLPTPTRAGHEFLGWYTASAGGAQVFGSTIMSANMTLYAQWRVVSGPDLYDPPAWENLDDDGNINWEDYYDGDEEAFAAEAAAVFNGYLLDGDEVAGSIQVKAAKKNKKTGESKVTATVNALGSAKKLSFKGTMGAGGVATLSCAGQPAMSLVLGTNAMRGELGAYEIADARDVFKKTGDPKASALSRWLGVYTLVLETADASGANAGLAWGYSGLSVEVKAKGKVKVTGSLVDGTKVSVAGQLLVGERKCCVPVVAPLYSKQGGFGFNLWLYDDGTTEVSNLSAWDADASKTPFTAWWSDDVPLARVGSALPSGLTFVFDGEYDLGSVELLYDFLPWEVSIGGGAKWTLPRAGSVKWDAEEEGYVDAKESENPAGLKLTYVAKTGAFKGSFKVYGDQYGRLKKYTANVSGVMVGTTGYGTAVIKNVGACPVRILP